MEDNREGYKDLYYNIRKQSKISFRKGMLAGHFLSRDIGRLCSVWFIKHNIVPNQITLLMILFGIIGSILFAIPNIWCKICGYLCWLMWFAMDCSDGQVARYTKNFSKYGTEMDYMAHLIDHPCMNLAIWATFIEMDLFNPNLVSLVFIMSISCELVSRNIFLMTSKIDFKLQGTNPSTPNLITYIVQQIILYPTLIICFSWIFILDYALNMGFSFYLFVGWLALYCINFLRLVIKILIKFMNE